MTQEIVRRLYDYDEASGVFTRRTTSNNNRKHKVGNVVGWKTKRGYLETSYKRKNYRLHRLAWLYVYGYMPIAIDHINHNTSDNRISNLREVEQKENMKNLTLSKSNTSGVVGVSWNKINNRWVASIQVDGKGIYLGMFTEFSDAVNARKNAEVLYGFHKNHGKG